MRRLPAIAPAILLAILPAILGLTLAGFMPAAARADRGEASPVLPVYCSVPGAPDDEVGRARFAEAARRSGLRPVQAVTLASPAAPRAPEALRRGIALADGLEFAQALRELDAAVAEATLTGGDGFTASELADLYLFRAVVTQKADPTASARAWDDFVRAATLAPERVLDPGRFPPAVAETWKRAAAEVQRRPRGTLVVRAPSDARVHVDGRPPIRSPAVVPGLPLGEHHVRVEEPGRMPWATVVPLTTPVLELEAPARAAVTLDDADAAAHARRAGARFALVAQLRPGGGEALLELRLVDAATERRRDGALVSLADGGDGVARAVAALERDVGRPSAADGAPVVPAAGPPGLARPPDPLATRRGPLVAAGAVALAVALALLLAVAAADDPRAGGGFSATVDPGRLGR